MYGMCPNGELPQIEGTTLIVPLVPNLANKNPIYVTIGQLYRGTAVIPERAKCPFVPDMLRLVVFKCNPNKYMSWLVRLGYATVARCKIVVYDEVGYLSLIDEFSSSMLAIYEYTVVNTPPFNFVMIQECD